MEVIINHLYLLWPWGDHTRQRIGKNIINWTLVHREETQTLRGELSTPQSQLRHNLGWWGQTQGGMAWTRP